MTGQPIRGAALQSRFASLTGAPEMDEWKGIAFRSRFSSRRVVVAVVVFIRDASSPASGHVAQDSL